MPRLRGREEIGLLEKYQRHALQEVLFALAVGGLSQRKVLWVGCGAFWAGSCRRPASGRCCALRKNRFKDAESSAWVRGAYPALAVDGIYLRYRRSAESPARKAVLLVAVGVREGGGFEVLELMAAAAETSQACGDGDWNKWS